MAIAFDTANLSNTVGTSLTFSHTCTGSDLVLVVGVAIAGTTDETKISGVTYNSVTVPQNNFVKTGATEIGYMYSLSGPSTGANNVVISSTDSRDILGTSASYTGAPGGIKDVTTFASGSTTNYSSSITPTDDNSWVVATLRYNADNVSAGAGTTRRTVNQSWGLYDNNAAITPPASTTLNYTGASGPGFYGVVMASISPTATVASPTIVPQLLTLGVG